MSREVMFWVWFGTMMGMVIVPMILGALLVHRFNREQDGKGHGKSA